MNVGLVTNTYSGITNGAGALTSARQNADNAKFSELLSRMQSQNDGRGTVASDEILENGTQANKIAIKSFLIWLHYETI